MVKMSVGGIYLHFISMTFCDVQSWMHYPVKKIPESCYLNAFLWSSAFMDWQKTNRGQEGEGRFSTDSGGRAERIEEAEGVS